LSRVEKHEALGINLPKKEYIIPKKPDETQEVLIKHRKFIEELDKKKIENKRKLEEKNKMKKYDVKVKD
jgi:microcompartment protein CcmL/EutN